MRCCSIIQDLITGVVPGVVDPDVTPQFLTYAIVPDPDLGGFYEWQFVGFDVTDYCNFPNQVFATNFGAEATGCFDAPLTTENYFYNWTLANGTPYGSGQSSFARDQSLVAAYYFIFWGQNLPPDMQITTSLAVPVVPNWQVLSPVCLTTTFTVDNIADGCYIEHFKYGDDDITTYEFGVLNTTDIASAGWPAYINARMPHATPTSIVVSIVGNDVTVTVQNVFHMMRGMKWYNPVTLNSGTTLFTICP